MSTIRIEKYDEVFLRIFSDQSIEQELSDFFKFRVPGYQYTPKFKNKLWDGWNRLYNLQTKKLYVGLLDYVFTFASSRGYTCELLEPVQTVDISRDQVADYAQSLNLHSKGGLIQIYDYQIDAIHNALHHKRALTLSPTSSGKSLIIYNIIRYHLEHDRKCIVVVPSTQLVEQLYSDFEDYSSHNGFHVPTNMQRLYSGFSKFLTTSVLITTWQSVVMMPKAFFNQFDVVIGDEAHQFKAVSMIKIMENLTDVEFRVGTTGTLDGSKVNKLVLEGLFGREFVVTTTKELMDAGKVVELKINCVMLKYDKETREALTGMDYKEEMMWLVTNPERNKFIRNLSISTSGNTLVLFQYVEKHGKKLYDMISARATDDRKVFFIHGGVDTEVREHIRKLCEKEKDAIIVASYGVFSTGINMPSIENIIFASPYKSKIKVLQSIGRGLRLNKGKDHCKLFDIADDLSHKTTKNHTLNHAVERYRIYMAEQFKVKIVNVEMK